MAGMAASLSGLVNGTSWLELFLCLIAHSINYQQSQVSLNPLLFRFQVMHWQSAETPQGPSSSMFAASCSSCAGLCRSLHNMAAIVIEFTQLPSSLCFISLFSSGSRTRHKGIYFNVNYFTAPTMAFLLIELLRWITHISYRLSAAGVPVRWPLRNSFQSIKLFIVFLTNTTKHSVDGYASKQRTQNIFLHIWCYTQ